MQSQIHLRKVDLFSVQVQVHRGGGNIQGEEADKGKLCRMWGSSGGVVPEGAYVEAV